MPDSNTVMLTATPRPLGEVPAPATGAPRNSAQMREMAQALLDMIAGAALTATPTGTVVAHAGNAAPGGWLLCDGRAVSRTTYAALYTVLGTRFGAGDGALTFNLPDLRGRTVIGTGQGTGLTNRALGAQGGAETHALSIPELPSHSHKSPTSAGNAYATPSPGNLSDFEVVSSDSTYTTYDYGRAAPTEVTGGNGAHNNMQPYLALNYIIRT